jgi:uncharacterized membrane protein
MNEIAEPLVIAAAVGSGLVGGVFFAFSTFVMPALGRLPAAQGTAAMQSINVMAPTPVFMTALFGTGLVCVLAVIAALGADEEVQAGWVLAGAALYVLGNLITTMLANVPLNNRLARVEPGSADGNAVWNAFLTRWTAWNHVRTVTGLAGSALLVIAVA